MIIKTKKLHSVTLVNHKHSTEHSTDDCTVIGKLKDIRYKSCKYRVVTLSSSAQQHKVYFTHENFFKQTCSKTRDGDGCGGKIKYVNYLLVFT